MEDRDISRKSETASISCKKLPYESLSFLNSHHHSIPKSIDAQIIEIKTRVSESWLLAPDEDGNFPTNGDRFTAQELTKRRDVEGFQRKGFLCQLAACGYHKKSPAQLREIAGNLGRERIQVVHGNIDNLITLPHAKVLLKELGGEEAGVTKVIFEGRGHYLPFEERREFKKVIAALIDKMGELR